VVQPIPPYKLAFSRIFHPTDFTPVSAVAFGHALKIAVAAQAELEIIHVASSAGPAQWHDYPRVRQTLARWGMISEHAEHADVEKTGVEVYKCWVRGPRPASALLRELDRMPADLVVLATHRRGLADRWFHEEVANKVARRSDTKTLFIPQGVRGFVALADGKESLQRILLPIDRKPCPQCAVTAAAALAGTLSRNPTEFRLLHIGPQDTELPAIRLPQRAGWTLSRTLRSGNVVTEILAEARDYAADLIVLATEGHDSLLDVLRGSTTERILREVACPVLAVPTMR
jgi:nucleotide-binding universal stress UspA family protein